MENEKKSMSEGDDDDNDVVMEKEKESTEGDNIIVEDNKVDVVVNEDDDCYCTEADYYYTHGYQTVVWKGNTDNKWLLKIDYQLDKERKKTAKSNEQKFNTSDIPSIFVGIDHARAYLQQFRDHVERVCRGKKKRKRKDKSTPPNLSEFQERKRKKTESRMLLKKKKEEDEMKKKAEEEEKDRKNREEWQEWRIASCEILEMHITSATTYKLLLTAPKDPKTLSTHVLEHTMRKSICLRQFLFAMKQRDNDDIGKKAADIAESVAEMNLVSKATLYQYYREWRDGEQIRREELDDRIKTHKIVDKTGLYESIYGFGSFQNDMRGSYKRPFLLEEEDIKIDFKRYIRKTLRTVTELKVHEFLNNVLLPPVEEKYWHRLDYHYQYLLIQPGDGC